MAAEHLFIIISFRIRMNGIVSSLQVCKLKKVDEINFVQAQSFIVFRGEKGKPDKESKGKTGEKGKPDKESKGKTGKKHV